MSDPDQEREALERIADLTNYVKTPHPKAKISEIHEIALAALAAREENEGRWQRRVGCRMARVPPKSVGARANMSPLDLLSCVAPYRWR